MFYTSYPFCLTEQKTHINSISSPPAFPPNHLTPSHQSDSNLREGLKRRNHSVVSEASPVPIFLQQGSAHPQIPQLAGTSPIDSYARMLFPIAFGLFNLFYWYIYLSKNTMERTKYVNHIQLQIQSHLSWYCYKGLMICCIFLLSTNPKSNNELIVLTRIVCLANAC